MLKKRATPTVIYHITGIDKTVTLYADAHNSRRHVSAGQLVDLFQLVEVRQDIWAKSAEFKKLEEHPDAKQDLIRFTARGVLGDIFQLHEPNVHVDLQITPIGKRVFAAQKYAKGGLKLVPYSQNIFSAAAEGTESDKKPTGPHMQMVLVRNETYIITFNVASAPKQDLRFHPTWPSCFSPSCPVFSRFFLRPRPEASRS